MICWFSACLLRVPLVFAGSLRVFCIIQWIKSGALKLSMIGFKAVGWFRCSYCRGYGQCSLQFLSIERHPLFSLSIFDRAVVVSHGILSILPHDSNHISTRWRVSNSNSGSNYSPLANGDPNWSDRPPMEMAPLFPGCDYEHWIIVMDAPIDGNATKQEMHDCYVKPSLPSWER